ncbi:MAG: hypothetical protein EHM77_09235 [Planctomycetaceae bacterium]|nr:MAG: hypothetical protein EHM77_09235 [Planctomycetaceae bacterium]
MQNRHEVHNGQPGYHTDPIYRDTIQRYLGWLAVACLIASLHAGPVMIFVWVAVAIALTRSGGGDRNRRRNQQLGNRNQGRRC